MCWSDAYLRSTISGAETLPEMHTSTPQPECMRIPKAAFFMLTEDALQNAFKRQAYSREKVARDALIGGNGQHLSKECCAAPCLVNTSSQIKQRHRFSLRTPKALPILSLLANRIVWMSSNMLGSAVSLNLCLLTKDGTLSRPWENESTHERRTP